MDNFEALKELLDQPRKIVIFPHRKPDADALGASLALAAFLNKKGHEATVISPTDYPDFLNWLPGNECVLVYEGNNTKAENLISESDVLFCLDFSSLDRIDNLGPIVAKSTATKVLIDHHLGKEDFADFELWNPKSAATAELVFDFINLFGDSNAIDLPMAQCIYAGIMTDTGSFKYSSTSGKTHTIIADLLDRGLKQEEIHRNIFDVNTENRIKFLGYALNEKLVILHEYKTAYIAITAEELVRFQLKTGDTEGLVNYPLSIQGIKLAVLFTDRSEHISMSFRSVGDFSVSEFANAHFNGGGHKNASGAAVKNMTLDEVVERFNKLLPFYREQLNK
ncbi:DHH family phosphoesterase [Flammeovirgaceae bacterium SG7u.111]|nr:DHH family phosphoesterase [Flammeovirgaceae bacterium SG7u.132]WPO34569.1 DHH family phosphoesterase [Flammeovirgaceae bacterium SG7u.111]